MVASGEMARTKRKASKHKLHFIQGCGTYTNQILVCVGYKAAEITALMKRLKLDKGAVAEFEKDHQETDRFFGGTHSGACWVNDGRVVMWFPEFRDDWDFWECLIHETNHVVFHIAKLKNMQDETEGQAYLQEYLFRRI